MMTFGMLYVFYRFFHPWKSEGVSVGFTPGQQGARYTINAGQTRHNLTANVHGLADLHTKPHVPDGSYGKLEIISKIKIHHG